MVYGGSNGDILVVAARSGGCSGGCSGCDTDVCGSGGGGGSGGSGDSGGGVGGGGDGDGGGVDGGWIPSSTFHELPLESDETPFFSQMTARVCGGVPSLL